MELKNCINERRSIRKYKYEEISVKTIEELILMAQKAPSWKNSQTARYYAVVSKEGREALHSRLASFNRERTSEAGAFIVTTVVHGISGYTAEKEPTHLGNGFECFDNGLAVQNLLLSAYEKGLGSLIMGLYDEKGIRELLSIPEGENIVAVIALGKGDISPEMPPRKPLSEILKVF